MGFLVKTIFFIKKGLGKEYVSGLINGIRLSNSKSGKLKKKKFEISKIRNYVAIQISLWINMIRILE